VRDVEHLYQLQTADARVRTFWLQFPAKTEKFCKSHHQSHHRARALCVMMWSMMWFMMWY